MNLLLLVSRFSGFLRRGRADLCDPLRVRQGQLSDLLQQGVQVGGLALAELPLLSGEFWEPLCRLLLGLLGQAHHLLHQLAATLGSLGPLRPSAAVRLVADDLEVQAVCVAACGEDGNTNLRRQNVARSSVSSVCTAAGTHLLFLDLSCICKKLDKILSLMHY